MMLAGAAAGVVLLPVTDYDQFVAAFSANADEPVTQLRMPGERRPYAKSIAGYAGVGINQEMVAAFKPPGNAKFWQDRLGKSGRGCLARSEVGLIINLERLAPVVQPMLEQTLQFQSENQTVDSHHGRAMATVTNSALAAFLRDTQTLVLALDADNQGVGLTVSAQFKPETRLAELFNGHGTAAAALLGRLPQDRFLVTSAINVQGLGLIPMVRDLIDHLPMDQLGDVAPMIQSQTELMQQVKAQAWALYDDSSLAPGAFPFGAILEVSDSAAYLKRFQNFLNQVDGKTISIIPFNEVAISASYTARARQVGKVVVDGYELRYEYSPKIPEMLSPAEPVFKMMGMRGAVGYIAMIDPHHIVQTGTRDVSLINKLVTSAQNDQGLGQDSQIPKLRAVGLGSNAAFEMYAHLPQISNYVSRMIELSTGTKSTVELPQDVPPVPIWVHAQDNSLVGRLYVQIDLIRWSRNVIAGELAGWSPG